MWIQVASRSDTFGVHAQTGCHSERPSSSCSDYGSSVINDDIDGMMPVVVTRPEISCLHLRGGGIRDNPETEQPQQPPHEPPQEPSQEPPQEPQQMPSQRHQKNSPPRPSAPTAEAAKQIRRAHKKQGRNCCCCVLSKLAQLIIIVIIVTAAIAAGWYFGCEQVVSCEFCPRHLIAMLRDMPSPCPEHKATMEISGSGDDTMDN